MIYCELSYFTFLLLRGHHFKNLYLLYNPKPQILDNDTDIEKILHLFNQKLPKFLSGLLEFGFVHCFFLYDQTKINYMFEIKLRPTRILFFFFFQIHLITFFNTKLSQILNR